MKFFLSLSFLFLLFPLASHAAENAGCYCDYSMTTGYTSIDDTWTITDTTTDQDSCTAACSAFMTEQNSQFGNGTWTLKEARYVSPETATENKAEEAQKKAELRTPELSINIPGISLTKPFERGGKIIVAFLPEYIAGVYRYALGIAAIFAIVMIMVGGVQYIIGSGTGGESASAAKTRIVNAVTGLVLVLAAYTILYVVNPKLTSFESLEIEYQSAVYFENDTEEEIYDSSGTASSGEVGTPDGANIYGGRKANVPKEMITDIETVAQAMASLGYGISITDGLRTLDEQKTAISKYCQNPPGSSSCDAKVAGQPACILKTLSALDCPHTSGRAIDMWATTSAESGEQSVTKSECAGSDGISKCRRDPNQAALISAMRDQGYCVLDSEPWHFEKPEFSKGKCH